MFNPIVANTGHLVSSSQCCMSYTAYMYCSIIVIHAGQFNKIIHKVLNIIVTLNTYAR